MTFHYDCRFVYCHEYDVCSSDVSNMEITDFWKVTLGSLMQPTIWLSGQSSWLQIQRSRVWVPGYPKFSEKYIGSATGSTQPREYN
jgi:hypothetical protein